MLESSIQTKIKKALEKTGWRVHKMRGQLTGTPDLLAFRKMSVPRQAYRLFYVEVKTPKGKCTPLQLETHRKLRAIGFTVFVATSVEDLRNQTTLPL